MEGKFIVKFEKFLILLIIFFFFLFISEFFSFSLGFGRAFLAKSLFALFIFLFLTFLIRQWSVYGSILKKKWMVIRNFLVKKRKIDYQIIKSPIIFLITSLYPFFLVIYLFMVLIQGFKWHGFFDKHFHLNPSYFLIASFACGLITYTLLSKRIKPSFIYRLMVRISQLFFKPFLFLSIVLIVINSPRVYLWVLRHFKFHWDRFTDALLIITIMLGLVVYFDPKSQKPIIRIGNDRKNGHFYFNFANAFQIKLNKNLFLPITSFIVLLLIFEGMSEKNILNLLISGLITILVTLISLILSCEEEWH